MPNAVPPITPKTTDTRAPQYPGYEPQFDETATRVRMVSTGGVPFKIAVRAAIEEVRGIIGDIAEGDVGSRLEDQPDMVENLEVLAGELEGLTERDVGGEPLALDEERTRVLEALIKEGESAGFIEIGHDETIFAENVQVYLQGGPVTYDELINLAHEDARDEFLKHLGVEPAPAPSM